MLLAANGIVPCRHWPLNRCSMTPVVYSLSIGPSYPATFAYSSLQVMINEELSTRTKMGGIRDVAQRPAFKDLPNARKGNSGVQAHQGLRDVFLSPTFLIDAPVPAFQGEVLPLYTTVPLDLISVKLATADALLKTFPRLKNLGSVRVTIVTGIDTVLPFPYQFCGRICKSGLTPR
ncbi:hypothetical protein ARMSODRAFT_316595 [Armillaria solidipes]|uniref:Uncharacterized protein n=1 Tax=Armillaria solidipes TaxID=1076256 RepID=A0A2H3BSL1_9AGAR|nr:hypothetical protein ARMSODRAFT_316595 [Armillaria solidipes]